MNLLQISPNETKGNDKHEILSKFTLELKFIDISLPDETIYEVLDWRVPETNINREIYPDDEIVSQVIHDFEYDNFPEVDIKGDDVHTIQLSVDGTYTQDCYGEVDLDIDVEVI